MRFALWLVGLFGVAVALALFAGSDPGTITLFWPPYRVDLSLNLFLVLLVFAFLLVHFALRALAALFALPDAAERWRARQQERAAHQAFLEALTHLMAGRFSRAREAARAVVANEPAPVADVLEPQVALRAGLSRLLLAESAHALRDRPLRDEQWPLALAAEGKQAPVGLREAVLLRSARFALDDGDADTALQRLASLTPGAARRTLAVRLKLAALRQAGRLGPALDTARLLARHRVMAGAPDVVRALALDVIAAAPDAAWLRMAFSQFKPHERALPQVAIAAALRLQALGGELATARQWLLPAWEQMAARSGNTLTAAERPRLVQALAPDAGADADEERDAAGFDAAWQDRIEAAHQRQPREPALQYLAALVCAQRQRWDKAEPLLREVAHGSREPPLARSARRALARYCERQGQ